VRVVLRVEVLVSLRVEALVLTDFKMFSQFSRVRQLPPMTENITHALAHGANGFQDIFGNELEVGNANTPMDSPRCCPGALSDF